MAAFDWSQCPVVESIPGKVTGEWAHRGEAQRIPLVNNQGSVTFWRSSSALCPLQPRQCTS